jgi:hypothetical protein
MLISFSVSNWKSIKDETSISWIAGREERFRDRLPYFENIGINVLPITAIYGANASGKSVLVSALSFAQRFVLYGSEPDASIDLRPFLLDNESVNTPTIFNFIMSIEDKVYEYSFTLSKSKVISEKLDRILKTTTQPVFERNSTSLKPEIKIHKVPKEQKKTLSLIGSVTTRDNQLFLTSTIYQDCDYFKDIYNWFKYSLKIITPNSTYRSVLDLAKPQNRRLYSKLLSVLDTGIVDLSLKKENLSSQREEKLRELFKDELKDGKTLMLDSVSKDRQVIELTKDRIEAKSLIPKHCGKDNIVVDFSFSMESDGTNRLLDILPAFVLLTSPKDVTVIIDELDRSLHTKLTKALISYYLNSCNKSKRSQLIFTTHDVMLMDQNIFRRDELCVIDRSAEGVTSICSLSDYKEVRSDLDIRKSYLQGNLGGIPNILFNELCSLSQKRGTSNE